MSTPNPELAALSPSLKQAIGYVIAALTTTLTGDPAQALLRAGPAFQIAANQIILLAPGALAAEEGVGLTAAVGLLNALAAKLP